MNRQDFLLCLLFFLIGIFTRFPFIERMQSHMDGPTYSIALVNYSFEQDNPTAPGYPLYIAVAKIFLLFTTDPHKAQLLLSVFLSGLGAGVFYLAGKSVAGRPGGVVASVLFLSSPSIYFFGLTVYGYLLVLIMTVLLVWCVYKISIKKKQLGLLLGVLYAVSLGVRPQEILTTLPLFLLGLYSLPSKERFKSLLSLFVVILVWLAPFIWVTGGFKHFIDALSLAAETGLPGPSVSYFTRKQFELGSGLFLTLGLGIPVLAVACVKYLSFVLKKEKISTHNKKLALFFAAWFVPSFLFNFFVRTEHAGYQFGYLSSLLFVTTLFLARSFAKKQLVLTALVFFIAVGNLAVFFYDRDPERSRSYRQTSFHYSDLRRNDYELSSKVQFVQKHFSPQDTILFSSTPFWKQFMYHLPSHTVYSVDGLFSNDRRYSLIVREANRWERQVHTLNSRRLELPDNARQIVLLDNDSCSWASDDAKRVFFAGNSCFVVVRLAKKNIVTFDYHKLVTL